MPLKNRVRVCHETKPNTHHSNSHRIVKNTNTENCGDGGGWVGVGCVLVCRIRVCVWYIIEILIELRAQAHTRCWLARVRFCMFVYCWIVVVLFLKPIAIGLDWFIYCSSMSIVFTTSTQVKRFFFVLHLEDWECEFEDRRRESCAQALNNVLNNCVCVCSFVTADLLLTLFYCALARYNCVAIFNICYMVCVCVCVSIWVRFLNATGWV